MADQTLAARCDALERQAAHAERTVDDLNAVVLDQQRALERLARKLDAAEDRIAALEHALRGTTSEFPPPHY